MEKNNVVLRVMTRVWKRLAILVSAGVLALSMAAPAAATAPADDGLSVDVEVQNDHYSITYYHNGSKLGSASFQAYGEHLYACDLRADGHVVSASLRWWDSGKQYKPMVRDSNGAKPGCGHENLDIDEGTPAVLKICVGLIGCREIDVLT